MKLPQQQGSGIAQPFGIFTVFGEGAILSGNGTGQQPIPISGKVLQDFSTQLLAVKVLSQCSFCF